jgi:hypothetical protein
MALLALTEIINALYGFFVLTGYYCRTVQPKPCLTAPSLASYSYFVLCTRSGSSAIRVIDVYLSIKCE